MILSGSLDDGTVGLREIKRAGGLAIVQDPKDTEWPSMPQSALKHVAVDYVTPADEIGTLLHQMMTLRSLVRTAPDGDPTIPRKELRELTAHDDEHDHPGEPSPYSCPDCGGVLWEIKDRELLRFRCRVGHAYTSDSLTTEQALTVEHALWTALRALEEQAAVRRRMADRASRNGNAASAERYTARARARRAGAAAPQRGTCRNRRAAVTAAQEAAAVPDEA